MHSCIYIVNVLHIEILNLKMLCLMIKDKLSSLILGFLLAFQTNRRSKSFVELLLIWHLKLLKKLSFVDHQLIFMLQVSYFLHFSVVNFHLEDRMTKSYTVKLVQVVL